MNRGIAGRFTRNEQHRWISRVNTPVVELRLRGQNGTQAKQYLQYDRRIRPRKNVINSRSRTALTRKLLSMRARLSHDTGKLPCAFHESNTKSIPGPRMRSRWPVTVQSPCKPETRMCHRREYSVNKTCQKIGDTLHSPLVPHTGFAAVEGAIPPGQPYPDLRRDSGMHLANEDYTL